MNLSKNSRNAYLSKNQNQTAKKMKMSPNKHKQIATLKKLKTKLKRLVMNFKTILIQPNQLQQ